MPWRSSDATLTKRVILVTGTPCVGKTSTAKALAEKLKAAYVNLTELAQRKNLTVGTDEERGSLVVDEKRMKREIRKLVDATDTDIVIDGHYAASVVPKTQCTHVFVLRRDPAELRELMRKSGFPDKKMYENLASEILDVCLVEAISAQGKERTCELNVTGETVNQIVGRIVDVLSGREECRVGIVDWLGKLEREGLLDEYLRI